MKWLDVSIPLGNDVLTWPGDPPTCFEDALSMEGDGVRVSRLVTGSHVGTHIDAPAHFLADGPGVDRIPPDVLVGPCRVLDLRGAFPCIRRQDLEPHRVQAGERVLLKTDNHDALRRPPFTPQYVALDESAAGYLVEAGAGLVGIDYLSIEPFDASEHGVHKALLSAGIVIVEGVDLADVEPGDFDLIALPLRLEGLDGSPARVLLRPRSRGSTAGLS